MRVKIKERYVDGHKVVILYDSDLEDGLLAYFIVYVDGNCIGRGRYTWDFDHEEYKTGVSFDFEGKRIIFGFNAYDTERFEEIKIGIRYMEYKEKEFVETVYVSLADDGEIIQNITLSEDEAKAFGSAYKKMVIVDKFAITREECLRDLKELNEECHGIIKIGEPNKLEHMYEMYDVISCE